MRPRPREPSRRPLRRALLGLCLAMGVAACTDDCLRRGANGECEVTCNQWKDGQCVHSCTKGIACD
jgi:hypothetical protein